MKIFWWTELFNSMGDVNIWDVVPSVTNWFELNNIIEQYDNNSRSIVYMTKEQYLIFKLKFL